MNSWMYSAWASYQIRKIAGAHAPGMAGTFSPPPRVSDPDMHHGTCVTLVPWFMSGSLTSSFLWSRRAGENEPGIPCACATHNFTYLARGPFLTLCTCMSSVTVAHDSVLIIYYDKLTGTQTPGLSMESARERGIYIWPMWWYMMAI